MSNVRHVWSWIKQINFLFPSTKRKCLIHCICDNHRCADITTEKIKFLEIVYEVVERNAPLSKPICSVVCAKSVFIFNSSAYFYTITCNYTKVMHIHIYNTRLEKFNTPTRSRAIFAGIMRALRRCILERY